MATGEKFDRGKSDRICDTMNAIKEASAHGVFDSGKDRQKVLQQENILLPDFNNNFNEGIPSLGKYGSMRFRYLKTVKLALFLDYFLGDGIGV